MTKDTTPTSHHKTLENDAVLEKNEIEINKILTKLKEIQKDMDGLHERIRMRIKACQDDLDIIKSELKKIIKQISDLSSIMDVHDLGIYLLLMEAKSIANNAWSNISIMHSLIILFNNK